MPTRNWLSIWLGFACLLVISIFTETFTVLNTQLISEKTIYLHLVRELSNSINYAHVYSNYFSGLQFSYSVCPYSVSIFKKEVFITKLLRIMQLIYSFSCFSNTIMSIVKNIKYGTLLILIHNFFFFRKHL